MNDQETMKDSARPVRIFRGLALAALVATAVTLAVLLLCAVWCSFTSFRCGVSADYHRYSTTVWNCGHGSLYEVAPSRTYLTSHLSYSLALLGPLFRVFDHPFMLAGVQWTFLVLGGFFLALIGRREGADALVTAAVVVFYFGYSFAHKVLLCEFHGIAAFLLLVPWLCYCLQNRSHFALVPFLILLGLREDAGLYILPLLLFAGWRYSWRPAYAYAAVALLYVLLAVFVLFPMVNGISLIRARSLELGLSKKGMATHKDWLPRLQSLGWIFLPVIPFLMKRCRREVLLIPSLAIVITVCSSYAYQYSLRLHYAASVHAFLGVGLALAAGCAARRSPPDSPGFRIFAVLWLLAATGIGYYEAGFLWGSSESSFVAYRRVDQAGLHSLWVARTQIPKEGWLGTELRLSGFAGNRAALFATILSKPEMARRMDLIWSRRTELPEIFYGEIQKGRFGVRYFDDEHVVLQRGGDCAKNAAFLIARNLPTVLFNRCPGQGLNRFVPGEGLVPCWRGGRGLRRPVAEHGAITLPAGSYTARWYFQSDPPPAAQTNWGWLNLTRAAATNEIASAAIAPAASTEPRVQETPFTLTGETALECAVIGADASLRIRKVEFVGGPTAQP